MSRGELCEDNLRITDNAQFCRAAIVFGIAVAVVVVV